jgi:hypothetical protein
MKYAELVAKLEAEVPHADYAVAWYDPDEYVDANYIIVPLEDGTFTLYRPTGRGEYYQDVDSDGNPRIFSTEDEVCQYVWKKSLEPKKGGHVPESRPDEAAAQRRAVLESLGIRADPYA